MPATFSILERWGSVLQWTVGGGFSASETTHLALSWLSVAPALSLSRPPSYDERHSALPLLPTPYLSGCPPCQGSHPQRTRFCQSQATPPTSTSAPPTSRLAQPSHRSATCQLASSP